MRIEKIIFSLLVLAQPAVAQPQFRIQANAAALRTHLSNATDNASDLVSSSPKITPNAGVILSWVKPNKNGFQGWRVGLEYLWYRQDMEGGYVATSAPNYRPTVFTTSSLHYLNLPLETRWGLAGKKGIVPFITLGVYASALLSYKETKSQTFGYIGIPEQSWVINTEVSGKSFSFDNDLSNFQGLRILKLTEGIYRPFAFGLVGSLGIDFHPGKRHFFSVRFPVRYGLTDIERKGEVAYEDASPYRISSGSGSNTPTYSYPVTYSYWKGNSPKGYPNARGQESSATHPFSYGLELSYGFVITPEKAQK